MLALVLTGASDTKQISPFEDAQSTILERPHINQSGPRGTQIAVLAHVKNDVEPGACMGGTPAKPSNEWTHEVAALRSLSKVRRNS